MLLADGVPPHALRARDAGFVLQFPASCCAAHLDRALVLDLSALSALVLSRV
ncbi:MAG: hypothetical protein AVDCRST_MAG48-2584 [uncultured Friedmanniella sp.]|uniref:Uncharacterized protein n=1 Tax=uncultured Friedmanniella sp. TaxID=335381 RepID=A0A6J4L0L1_9ACTN|nr:MAG: hypothetical protein AVDCRST_MAG48-2584 [uncultured Friedmanniella sp.]